MSKHTDTPLTHGISNAIHRGYRVNIYDANGEVIGYTETFMDDEQCLANAEFIVRACNMHEELVETVKKLSEYINVELSNLEGKLTLTGGEYEDKETMTDLLDKAKQALAKAEATNE